LTAAVVAAPVGVWGRSFTTEAPASVGHPSFSDLADQIHTKFRVYLPTKGVVELELVKASLDPQRPQHGQQPAPDADYEKFSLIFTGRRDELLEQRILTFEHDRIGRFDLLALPIFALQADQVSYEAVFNRPRPPLPSEPQNRTKG